MCHDTSEILSLPPQNAIVGSPPQRAAKNSVCPGNAQPIAAMRSLLTGAVTTPANSPAAHIAADRSSAAHATSALSPSGSPGRAS